MSKYEESNLAKALPTLYNIEHYKVLDIKLLDIQPIIGCVLTFDLIEKRMKCFISCVDSGLTQNEAVEKIVTHGATLPSRLCFVLFKEYFIQEEMIKLLDRDAKLFLKMTELLED